MFGANSFAGGINDSAMNNISSPPQTFSNTTHFNSFAEKNPRNFGATSKNPFAASSSANSISAKAYNSQQISSHGRQQRHESSSFDVKSPVFHNNFGRDSNIGGSQTFSSNESDKITNSSLVSVNKSEIFNSFRTPQVPFGGDNFKHRSASGSFNPNFGTKPTCRVCQAVFATFDELKRHIKTSKHYDAPRAGHIAPMHQQQNGSNDVQLTVVPNDIPNELIDTSADNNNSTKSFAFGNRPIQQSRQNYNNFISQQTLPLSSNISINEVASGNYTSDLNSSNNFMRSPIAAPNASVAQFHKQQQPALSKQHQNMFQSQQLHHHQQQQQQQDLMGKQGPDKSITTKPTSLPEPYLRHSQQPQQQSQKQRQHLSTKPSAAASLNNSKDIWQRQQQDPFKITSNTTTTAFASSLSSVNHSKDNNNIKTIITTDTNNTMVLLPHSSSRDSSHSEAEGDDDDNNLLPLLREDDDDDDDSGGGASDDLVNISDIRSANDDEDDHNKHYDDADTEEDDLNLSFSSQESASAVDATAVIKSFPPPHHRPSVAKMAQSTLIDNSNKSSLPSTSNNGNTTGQSVTSSKPNILNYSEKQAPRYQVQQQHPRNTTSMAVAAAAFRDKSQINVSRNSNDNNNYSSDNNSSSNSEIISNDNDQLLDDNEKKTSNSNYSTSSSTIAAAYVAHNQHTVPRPTAAAVIKTGESDNAEATAAIGTCEDMCPAEERAKRVQENDVHKLELLFLQPSSSSSTAVTAEGLSSTMIKKFQRSSADHVLQIPHLLRTPGALARTIVYIEDHIMDSVGAVVGTGALFVYLFIWDRYRMIAKDFTLQQQALVLLMQQSSLSQQQQQQGLQLRLWVECHERMARWFIYMDHKMQEDEDFVQGHAQQNGESLNNLLKTLHGYYFSSVSSSSAATTTTASSSSSSQRRKTDQSDAWKSAVMPNAAEFVAYFVLFQLGNAGEVSKYLQQLPHNVLNSEPVRFAIRVWGALKTENISLYFRLLNHQATLLQACLMHRYVGQVRLIAMRKLSRTLGRGGSTAAGGGQEYAVADLMRIFLFENTEDALEFIDHCGLETVVSSSIGNGDNTTNLSVLLCGQNIDAMLPRDKNDHPIMPRTRYMQHFIDQSKRRKPSQQSIASTATFTTSQQQQYTVAEICRGAATGSVPPVSPPARPTNTYSSSSSSGSSYSTTTDAATTTVESSTATAPLFGVRIPTTIILPITEEQLQQKQQQLQTLIGGSNRGSSSTTTVAAAMSGALGSSRGTGASKLVVSTGSSNNKITTRSVCQMDQELDDYIKQKTDNTKTSKASHSPATVPMNSTITAATESSSDNADVMSWRKGKIAEKSTIRTSDNNNNISSSGSGSKVSSTNETAVIVATTSTTTSSSVSFASQMELYKRSNNNKLSFDISHTNSAAAGGAALGGCVVFHPPSIASSLSAATAISSAVSTPKKTVTINMMTPPAKQSSEVVSAATTVPLFSSPVIIPNNLLATTNTGGTALAVAASSTMIQSSKANIVDKQVNRYPDSGLIQSNESSISTILQKQQQQQQSISRIEEIRRPAIDETKLQAFQVKILSKQRKCTLRDSILQWQQKAKQMSSLRTNKVMALFLLIWRQSHRRSLKERHSLIKDLCSIRMNKMADELSGMNLGSSGSSSYGDNTTTATGMMMSGRWKRKAQQQQQLDRKATAAAIEKESLQKQSLLCDGIESFLVKLQPALIAKATKAAVAVSSIQAASTSILSVSAKCLFVLQACNVRKQFGYPVAESTLTSLQEPQRKSRNNCNSSSSGSSDQMMALQIRSSLDKTVASYLPSTITAAATQTNDENLSLLSATTARCASSLYFKLAVVSNSYLSGVWCSTDIIANLAQTGSDADMMTNLLRALLSNQQGYIDDITSSSDTTTTTTILTKNQLFKAKRQRDLLAREKVLASSSSSSSSILSGDSSPISPPSCCCRIGLHTYKQTLLPVLLPVDAATADNKTDTFSTMLTMSIVDICSQDNNLNHNSKQENSRTTTTIEALTKSSTCAGTQAAVLIASYDSIHSHVTVPVATLQSLLEYAKSYCSEILPIVLIIIVTGRRTENPDTKKDTTELLSSSWYEVDLLQLFSSTCSSASNMADKIAKAVLQHMQLTLEHNSDSSAFLQHFEKCLKGCLILTSNTSTFASVGDNSSLNTIVNNDITGRQTILDVTSECLERAVQLLTIATSAPLVSLIRTKDWLQHEIVLTAPQSPQVIGSQSDSNYNNYSYNHLPSAIDSDSITNSNNNNNNNNKRRLVDDKDNEREALMWISRIHKALLYSIDVVNSRIDRCIHDISILLEAASSWRTNSSNQYWPAPDFLRYDKNHAVGTLTYGLLDTNYDFDNRTNDAVSGGILNILPSNWFAQSVADMQNVIESLTRLRLPSYQSLVDRSSNSNESGNDWQSWLKDVMKYQRALEGFLTALNAHNNALLISSDLQEQQTKQRLSYIYNYSFYTSMENILNKLYLDADSSNSTTTDDMFLLQSVWRLISQVMIERIDAIHSSSSSSSSCDKKRSSSLLLPSFIYIALQSDRTTAGAGEAAAVVQTSIINHIARKRLTSSSNTEDTSVMSDEDSSLDFKKSNTANTTTSEHYNNNQLLHQHHQHPYTPIDRRRLLGGGKCSEYELLSTPSTTSTIMKLNANKEKRLINRSVYANNADDIYDYMSSEYESSLPKNTITTTLDDAASKRARFDHHSIPSSPSTSSYLQQSRQGGNDTQYSDNAYNCHDNNNNCSGIQQLFQDQFDDKEDLFFKTRPEIQQLVHKEKMAAGKLNDILHHAILEGSSAMMAFTDVGNNNNKTVNGFYQAAIMYEEKVIELLTPSSSSRVKTPLVSMQQNNEYAVRDFLAKCKHERESFSAAILPNMI